MGLKLINKPLKRSKNRIQEQALLFQSMELNQEAAT